MDKMIIKITLAIIGTNLQTGEHNIVSLEKDTLVLPYSELSNNNSILGIIENLEQKYIDLDTNWISTKLISCLQQPNELLLIYVCHIPLDTILKDTYWLPIWQCLNNLVTSEITKYI